ncbi:MAG: hypothetical protein M3N52_11945 [Actinomycetota bacterium]|nr:hypothetical protein [Actinomycetota bacterium]
MTNMESPPPRTPIRQPAEGRLTFGVATVVVGAMLVTEDPPGTDWWGMAGGLLLGGGISLLCGYLHATIRWLKRGRS